MHAQAFGKTRILQLQKAIKSATPRVIYRSSAATFDGLDGLPFLLRGADSQTQLLFNQGFALVAGSALDAGPTAGELQRGWPRPRVLLAW